MSKIVSRSNEQMQRKRRPLQEHPRGTRIIERIGKLNPEMPIMNWEYGLKLLLCAHCPWCGNPIRCVTTSEQDGLTWACAEGCNP